MRTACGFDIQVMSRLRTQRRWAIFWVAAYVPFGLALLYCDASVVFGSLAMLTWFAVAAVALVRLRLNDCPRCGLMFYAESVWGMTNLAIPFTAQCMHCGFEVDGSDDEPIL
jgi:hypothetical protein